MNIADYIIIVLLVLGAVNGYRRGLIESLAGLFGSLVGFVVAWKYYAPVTVWANSFYPFTETVNSFFRTNLVLPKGIMQFRLDMVPLNDLAQYLEKTELPEYFKTQLVNYLHNLGSSISAQGNLGDIIYLYLGEAAINAAAFLIIWGFVVIGIALVVSLWKGFTGGSIIGGFDKLCGLLVGGLVTAFTLMVIIGMLNPLLALTRIAEPSLMGAFFKTMGEARLLPYFMEAFNFFSAKLFTLWF